MSPKRRVAILGPAPPDRGGIARETALLAGELSDRAHVDVAWYTFARRYPRWLDPRRFDEDPGLPPAAARRLLDYGSPGSWKRTAAAIASENAEALLIPWWTAFWGLPYRAVMRRLTTLAPATRRILLCHNVEDHEGGLTRRFFARGAFLAADGFIAHSSEDRDRLARIRPEAPALLLPHPVRPGPAPRSEDARRRLGLPDGPLLLFLGLVRRYKGVELLLDAAPSIVRESGATIGVVGEVFPDARDLAKRARLNPVANRILWHDAYLPEEELALWLAACDAVVLPYRAISGSGIAARALAAERPMVAAAVGGLKETVVPGVTGELFAPGDAAGLAAATNTVLARGAAFYAPGLRAAAAAASWPKYVDAILEFVSLKR